MRGSSDSLGLDAYARGESALLEAARSRAQRSGRNLRSSRREDETALIQPSSSLAIVVSCALSAPHSGSRRPASAVAAAGRCACPKAVHVGARDVVPRAGRVYQ